jgi:UDP-N-acetylmuramoyl-L-alanyl-D-glutamate--2,6-diaminopimelate ligase
MFFDNLPSTAFALSNMDDANGVVMLQNTKAPKTYYGLLNATADYKAKINELDFHGMHLIVDNEDVWVTLTGVFNAYNLLAIYATARLLGINKTDALCGISTLTSAEGRFNVFISDNGVIAIVDYAHTPDALQNVLNTIRKIQKPTQKLITVVGCGGNRDKNKRPEMAKIANDLSSQLIITSDNPRDEDPEAIIADMMKGIINHEKVLTLVNREQAIKLAVRLADKRDIILIAGKGHEKYQEIKGVKHHFDDVEIVKKYLSIN